MEILIEKTKESVRGNFHGRGNLEAIYEHRKGGGLSGIPECAGRDAG